MSTNNEKTVNANKKIELQLKLFVAGEFSGDPAEWENYSTHKLVLAENAEDARSLLEFNDPVIEVRIDRPVVLR